MKTRPIAQRDMTLRSPREIAAHLAFAAYVLALPAALAALGLGAVRSSPTAIALGVLALTGFGALHRFARQPLDFAGILRELKRNPFKAARVPKPEAGDERNCETGACGLS